MRGSFEGCGVSIAHIGRDAHSRDPVPYLRSLISDSTLVIFALPGKDADSGIRELCSRQADLVFVDAEGGEPSCSDIRFRCDLRLCVMDCPLVGLRDADRMGAPGRSQGAEAVCGSGSQ
jgi:hypothetical protein